MNRGALRVSLAAISAAVLAYELVLVHLLSIAHWTHFAALVISLALLGFGASGTFVTLLIRATAGREKALYGWAVALTAVTFDPAWRVAAAIPFDAFELLAVPRQFVYLTLTYLVLSVPFLFGGAAVALAFRLEASRVSAVYAANLLGSGLGAGLGLVAIETLSSEVLPLAVFVLATVALVPLHRWGRLAPPAALLVMTLLPSPTIPVSDYKEGTVALRLPDAQLVEQSDGALGRLQVVESPALRYLPGTSLAIEEPLPSRPVLYRNGQPLGPLSVAEDAPLLLMTTTAAVFAVTDVRSPDVLLLGADGGAGIRLARAAGASRITVADPDERIDDLLAPGTLGPDVHRVRRDPRGFLRAAGSRRFDRILVTEVGSLAGGAAGMAAGGEGYLFTREGVADMLGALTRGGVLAVTRWMLDPPRDALRLLATARDVLVDQGRSPERHVAIVRGWGTVTLLVTRSPLARSDVDRLRDWCERRWFDIAWAPGLPPDASNRFNILEPDRFRIAGEAILGADPELFFERYPFLVEPVTDDSPFFFHFLPIQRIPEMWRERGRLSLPYFEWGLVAQGLALIQAIPVALILILAPLGILPWSRRRAPGWSTFTYFALLGAAFMLLEISTIQRLILVLAHPIYATATVLVTFLVVAGAGSTMAPRLMARVGPRVPLWAIVALAPLAFGANLLLWRYAVGLATPARIALSAIGLAPLAFFMGMPFPMGLQWVSNRKPDWVPWCWGVNGFLSVIGAVMAPLVALAIGFRGVLMVAMILYALAATILVRLIDTDS